MTYSYDMENRLVATGGQRKLPMAQAVAILVLVLEMMLQWLTMVCRTTLFTMEM
jgi:hypothetical protein